MSLPELPKPQLSNIELLKAKSEDPISFYYKAKRNGKTLLLRILRAEKKEKYKALFLEQAESQNRVQHPFAFKFLETWEQDEFVLQSYEYQTSESIYTYFKREKKVLKEEHGLKIMKCLSELFIYTESQGIMHRSLNPKNLFISSRGISVHEFGFIQDPTEWFYKNSAKLSPSYISAEQAHGTPPEKLTIQSDIYSAGMVLFHMLVGYPAFKGSKLEVMSAHVKEDVPWPKDINPHLSDDVCHLILQMTKKEPTERFASATTFQEAVELTRQGKYQPKSTKSALPNIPKKPLSRSSKTRAITRGRTRVLRRR